MGPWPEMLHGTVCGLLGQKFSDDDDRNIILSEHDGGLSVSSNQIRIKVEAGEVCDGFLYFYHWCW